MVDALLDYSRCLGLIYLKTLDPQLTNLLAIFGHAYPLNFENDQ